MNQFAYLSDYEIDAIIQTLQSAVANPLTPLIKSWAVLEVEKYIVEKSRRIEAGVYKGGADINKKSI